MANKLSFVLLFFFFTIFNIPSFSCDDLAVGKLSTLQKGRIRPLYTHMQESLAHLLDSSKPPKEFTPCSFLALSSSLDFHQEKKQELETLLIKKVPHEKVREIILSLSISPIPKDSSQKNFFYRDLIKQKHALRNEWESQEKEDSLKKELAKLLEQIHLYEEIISGRGLNFHNKSSEHPWISFEEILTFKKFTQEEFFEFLKNQEKISPPVLLEYWYTKLNPLKWALIFSLLCALLLALPHASAKLTIFAYTIGSLSLLLQTMAFIWRTLISQRAPITNMYETVVFSGYACFLLSFLGHKLFSVSKITAIAGLVYNILSLLLIQLATTMFSSSINPLVPVLRDNFWLSTHVTSVILSYAAFALSWILANFLLLFPRSRIFSSHFEDLAGKIRQNIYTCLKIGTTLIALGIILGGVWADYSWGRFWDWDPKEVGSLIVLLVYIAILHGKYTNWIPHKHFEFYTALAFLSVMMAWFGVNYVLAAGLHSYGFSEGGAVFLSSFFLVQILIVLKGLYSRKLLIFK